MELILMRHGKSPSLHEAGVSTDEERPLADLGHKQAKRAGKALVELESRPTLILASPLRRARETAEGALSGIGDKVPLKVFPPLQAGAAPGELLEALQPHAKEPRLMLIGHQPDLGALASFLLSGEADGSINLKPGGMLLIELDRLSAGAAASLRWLLLPTQIEKIA